MPRSTTPETFGPEYAELLRAAQQKNGLTLPFPSKREAYLFRLRIYAYFRALRADKKAVDLIALANYFQVKFEPGPPAQLLLVPSSSLPDRQYLQQLLNLPGQARPDEPASVGTLSARLKEMRTKRPK